MKPSHYLCLLFLVSILVASSAVTVTWEKASKARAPALLADEAFLARLCDREQQRGRPPRILPWWCTRLHARRQGAHHQYHHHHLPMPPPSRDDDEQIDPRYGVSKRLVPSGPNRLHN